MHFAILFGSKFIVSVYSPPPEDAKVVTFLIHFLQFI